MSTSLRKKMNLRKLRYHPLDPDIRPATKSTYENQDSNRSRLSTPIRRAKDKKPSSVRTFFMEREYRAFLKKRENIYKSQFQKNLKSQFFLKI